MKSYEWYLEQAKAINTKAHKDVTPQMEESNNTEKQVFADRKSDFQNTVKPPIVPLKQITVGCLIE